MLSPPPMSTSSFFSRRALVLSLKLTGATLLAPALALVACGGGVDSTATVVPADGGSGDAQASDAGPASDDAEGLADEGDRPPLDGALLFAGYSGGSLADTWDWDGTRWVQAQVVGPSKRDSQSMGSLHGKVVLFGGDFAGTFLGDTWEWDGRTWTEKKVSGPSPRREAAMATLGDKIVLYGGTGSGQLDDTWTWDGTSWTEVKTPGPGGLHGIASAMATLGDKVVLFGGIGTDTATWEFDGATWTKKAVTPAPPARGYHAMATLNDRVILFGGEVDANHFLGDTWIWDGSTWTELKVPGPSARFHPAMSAVGNSVVLFGGAPVVAPGAQPFFGDTWTCDGATWTQVTTAIAPSPRYAYQMATR